MGGGGGGGGGGGVVGGGGGVAETSKESGNSVNLPLVGAGWVAKN